MAWKSLSSFSKGWIIGFFIGLIHIILVVIISANTSPNYALIISKLITHFTKLFNPCIDCMPRTYYILFASPIIFAFVGAIISFIILGVTSYQKKQITEF